MWDNSNDVEYLLNQDNREKRQASSGAKHNSGRRGGGLGKIKQGIRTPADVLKANNKQAYKEYTKASVVIVSHIYDDIKNVPSIKEINAMSFDEASKIVKLIKDRHTSKALQQYWNMSSGTLYNTVLHKYGAATPRNSPRKNKVKSKEIKVVPKEIMVMPEDIKISYEEEDEGFQLKYNKKNTIGEDLLKRMMKWESVIDSEKNYEIKFFIKEL